MTSPTDHRLYMHEIGVALPAHEMTQGQAVQLTQATCCDTDKQRRLIETLFRRAGVESRRTALPHQIALEWLETSPCGPASESGSGKTLGPTTRERMGFYQDHAFPLAFQAARAALDRAGGQPETITHLVTVSCTGFYAPGVDIALIKQLKLPATTQRLHIGFMGCHGAINGLRACLGVASHESARVLLCAVELCSLHYRFQWDPERLTGNALFADGAAAAVLDTQPTSDAWALLATGSCLLPDSEDQMTWEIGDHGFEMRLSSQVPESIRASLPEFLDGWLAEQGVRRDEVAHWVVHPGGPRILTAVEEALQLDESATRLSREILASFGNMSSPTVLFILQRLSLAPTQGPCVVLGFGPGLVAEVALLMPASEVR